MHGTRLVIATETQAGRAWDEAKIKAITGGEKQTARFMRQDFFDFEPTFKLFISGNHKPRLGNVDEAMRRRMLLVPFTVQIPKAERDPKLKEKLRAEWPAILRWALDGCLEWQRIGLAPPAIVTEATNRYFDGQLVRPMVGRRLRSMSAMIPWATVAELFEKWSAYGSNTGDKLGSKMAFSERMTGRGFVACRKGNPQVRAFSGVRLKFTTRDDD